MKKLITTLSLCGLFAAISAPMLQSNHLSKNSDPFWVYIDGGVSHEGSGNCDYYESLTWKINYSSVAGDWKSFTEKYSTYKVIGDTFTHTWEGTNEKTEYSGPLSIVPEHGSGIVLVFYWNSQSASSGLAYQKAIVEVEPYHDNQYFYLTVAIYLYSTLSYDGVWASFDMSQLWFN